MDPGIKKLTEIVCESIRVRGVVQGVGFRPTVWRIANDCGLVGGVINDAEGVLVRAKGQIKYIDEFVRRLVREAPPLARIDSIERQSISAIATRDQFNIDPSNAGAPHTGIVADAATCASCIKDIFEPNNRRYRYPFTNCTHCGPRFSIIKTIPYDRCNTSMRDFTLCMACDAEYQSPSNRRFHAQPNACPECGPTFFLESKNGLLSSDDDIGRVEALIRQGEIIAIKGIGGFHLACNALNETTVKRLRSRKRRYAKPFALMARDLKIISEYCELNQLEEQILKSPQAPIVLLKINHRKSVADAVAPGQSYLGFMLPYTPVHHLLLKNIDYPIVLTSGNISDEPQCIDNNSARNKLNPVVDYFLMNDRDIVNRIDDSVVKVIANAQQIFRRARGYAPAPVALPEGFENCPEVIAMGGELKNTFCLIKDNKAIVSQHIGDLENAVTFMEYRKNLELYFTLYRANPDIIAVDSHPEYLSGKEGKRLSEQTETPLITVQHHHAHIASCMAENQIPFDTGPILGVALDGLGFGDDNTLWGGEFLLADYKNFKRLATFKPIPMPGGVRAIYEPWRNTYAHIKSLIGWENYRTEYHTSELSDYLESKPLASLDTMMEKNVNSPRSSSCGRLFDAVAATLGICRERVTYEGQAAMEMEAIIDSDGLLTDSKKAYYPFSISSLDDAGLPCIDPKPMWQALLKDQALRLPKAVIAARFHSGLANIICNLINDLSSEHRVFHGGKTVALSGGVFQNKILSELVISRLKEQNFTVLKHQNIPANDGGLSFGQAVIAGARMITN